MDMPIIQLLVLAGIAIFLILRLRSVLGTRDGFERPPVSHSEDEDRRNSFEVIDGGPDRDIIDHAAVGARISVVALHYNPVPTSYLTLLMKELTLRGSIEYPPRFADAIDVLARRDLSALLTHRYPLERFGDALAALKGSRDCGKVLVTVDPSQW